MACFLRHDRWCRKKSGRVKVRRDRRLPRDDLDVDTFAFEILHRGAQEDTFPRKNSAEAWFEFRNAGRYELFEQSFLLPDDEVLTVLTIPEDGLG